MATQFRWVNGNNISVYVNVETEEVKATVEYVSVVGGEYLWEWTERKRRFMGLASAKRAVERYA